MQDHLQRRLDERKQRQRGKVLAKHGSGSGIGAAVGVVVSSVGGGGGNAGPLVSRVKQTRSSVPSQLSNKIVSGVHLRSAAVQQSPVVGNCFF